MEIKYDPAMIGKMSVKEGDVIVLKLPSCATEKSVAAYHGSIKLMFPNNHVIIIHEGCEIRIAENEGGE